MRRPCVCRKFSAFRLSRYIDHIGISTVKTSPYNYPGFDGQKFCKTETEITEIIENFDICQKCQKYTRIFENSKSSGLNSLFSLLPVTYSQNCHT